MMHNSLLYSRYSDTDTDTDRAPEHSRHLHTHQVVALLDNPPRGFIGSSHAASTCDIRITHTHSMYACIIDELSPQHRELLARGARIRAQRARCLASRAAAIRDHCQLLPGLVDFVVAFAEPSIDDLYEDVYFTERSRLRRRGPQVPLRRSLRLRQKRG